MTDVVVRRSAWRMWLTSLVATPLIVLAVDVLTQRRITNGLRDLLFRPDDTQLFEFRDVVWAWVILISAGAVAIWALRELIVPTKVVAADEAGVRLQVSAPFRKPLFVAWSDVEDIGSATVDDEGEAFPVLWLRLGDIDVGLPEPWSARWMDDRTLALMASDWDVDPIDVARQLTDLAVEASARSDLATESEVSDRGSSAATRPIDAPAPPATEQASTFEAGPTGIGSSPTDGPDDVNP